MDKQASVGLWMIVIGVTFSNIGAWLWHPVIGCLSTGATFTFFGIAAYGASRK
jgi:hypothetical protein